MQESNRGAVKKLECVINLSTTCRSPEYVIMFTSSEKVAVLQYDSDGVKLVLEEDSKFCSNSC